LAPAWRRLPSALDPFGAHNVDNLSINVANPARPVLCGLVSHALHGSTDNAMQKGLEQVATCSSPHGLRFFIGVTGPRGRPRAGS
jgi:hypothetical protein